MEIRLKLKEENDKWLREIAREIGISPEELAHVSIENFVNEYRQRKAIRKYVEGEVSLGKAAEIAGVSKRKFMAILKDTGIPLNVGVQDFVRGFESLSKLRGYERSE